MRLKNQTDQFLSSTKIALTNARFLKVKIFSNVAMILLLMLTVNMLIVNASPISQAAPNILALATTSIGPSADAYVHSAYPTKNYGTSTQLRGDNSPVVRSYLRFNVQGVSGAVTSATLRVYANSSASGGYNIRGVSNDTWAETAITYDNAPAVGNVLGSSGSFSSGVWTSVSVTAYVTGNGTYNLALTVPGSQAISFASRESGSHAPQLIIVTGSGSTPTKTPISGSTPTKTATPGSSSTSTPIPPTSGSVVMVGAGDISNCNNNNDEATAKLLDSIPGTVFTAGDNAYSDGTYTQFVNCYNPTWGRSLPRTHPSPGNHDYNTSGAAGYYQYFSNVSSYYAFNLGSWRIYSLNSEISVSSTSPQVTWLKADLAAHPTPCVMAYWHKPRFSSGSTHGSNSSMQTLWSVLFDAGADLVINGHEHNYERFAQMNASGATVSQGLREIVVGTGGEGHYSFGSTLSASQVRNSSTYGVVKLTLSSNSYTWQFVPVAGSTFTDSGSSNCH
jgi:acid phosphatase type 7